MTKKLILGVFVTAVAGLPLVVHADEWNDLKQSGAAAEQRGKELENKGQNLEQRGAKLKDEGESLEHKGRNAYDTGERDLQSGERYEHQASDRLHGKHARSTTTTTTKKTTTEHEHSRE